MNFVVKGKEKRNIVEVQLLIYISNIHLFPPLLYIFSKFLHTCFKEVFAIMLNRLCTSNAGLFLIAYNVWGLCRHH